LVVDEGDTVPAPSSVTVTDVALPPKVLLLTVTGEVPQAVPLLEDKFTEGPFTHPHETVKEALSAVHPAEFLATIT
jgi:hypothetical protein